jgi:hypothetical protein
MSGKKLPEFERFEKVTRDLIQVPRKEFEEKMAEYEGEKRARLAKKKPLPKVKMKK